MYNACSILIAVMQYGIITLHKSVGISVPVVVHSMSEDYAKSTWFCVNFRGDNPESSVSGTGTAPETIGIHSSNIVLGVLKNPLENIFSTRRKLILKKVR